MAGFIPETWPRRTQDGHYRIVGRKKDMFISGGINIYPAEIERIIETDPRVAAVAVIGVPDEKWGEIGKACLVLHPGERFTLEELQMFLRDKMAQIQDSQIPGHLGIAAANGGLGEGAEIYPQERARKGR